MRRTLARYFETARLRTDSLSVIRSIVIVRWPSGGGVPPKTPFAEVGPSLTVSRLPRGSRTAVFISGIRTTPDLAVIGAAPWVTAAVFPCTITVATTCVHFGDAPE